MLQNTFEIFQQPQNTADDVRNTAEHFYKLGQYSIDDCDSDVKNQDFSPDLLTEF